MVATGDLGLANAAALPQFSDGSDVGIAELACAVGLRLAPFANHVLGVVARLSQKQVVGVHAVSNIAAMKDPPPLWNVAVVQHPGVAVCGGGGTRSGLKHAVALVSEGPRPEPARLRLVDVEPKAILMACRRGLHATGMAAILALSRRQAAEHLTAVFAGACGLGLLKGVGVGCVTTFQRAEALWPLRSCRSEGRAAELASPRRPNGPTTDATASRGAVAVALPGRGGEEIAAHLAGARRGWGDTLLLHAGLLYRSMCQGRGGCNRRRPNFCYQIRHACASSLRACGRKDGVSYA